MKSNKEYPEYKTTVVDEYVNLIKEYPLVGAVDMENLPTKQLQNMRAQLRGKVVIKVGKRRLMNIALERANKFKPGIDKLKEHLKGMPGLIFTRENPFSLYKTLAKNKSTAPAKAGQVAPKDVVVPAGPTGFAPGPIIGQLGAAGIQAGIENGKVIIKKDAIVAKDGEVITAELAGILTRLGIEPMEIGLALTATFEDGNIFTRKVLDIDEQEYLDNVTTAHRWAFNLAMDAGILTVETTELMVTKAFTDSRNLAVECNILADQARELILSKAHRHAVGLKAYLNV